MASVRAETYCNLFSLSVEHFNAVLEHYPVMRRTMESVAAERLNKIGKNPSIVSNRAELEEDINTVNELIMQTTPMPSSGSEMSIAEKLEALNPRGPKEKAMSLKKSKSDCYVGGTKEDRESLVWYHSLFNFVFKNEDGFHITTVFFFYMLSNGEKTYWICIGDIRSNDYDWNCKYVRWFVLMPF